MQIKQVFFPIDIGYKNTLFIGWEHFELNAFTHQYIRHIVLLLWAFPSQEWQPNCWPLSIHRLNNTSAPILKLSFWLQFDTIFVCVLTIFGEHIENILITSLRLFTNFIWPLHFFSTKTQTMAYHSMREKWVYFWCSAYKFPANLEFFTGNYNIYHKMVVSVKLNFNWENNNNRLSKKKWYTNLNGCCIDKVNQLSGPLH